MSGLTNKDKEVVLDFYFNCGSDEHIALGRDLIANSPGAAQLYADLEMSLTHLGQIKEDPCPDHLAASTVTMLKDAAENQQNRLGQLLQREQQKISRDIMTAKASAVSFWKNVSQMLTAAAAVVLILAGVMVPTVNNMRQKAWQTACSNNLRLIGQGVERYQNDNDALPAVASVAGDPWWKVGNQGEENHSNTRHLWVLVKDGYVNADNFVCAGRKNNMPVAVTPESIQTLNDFPSRDNITYSFMFMCPKISKKGVAPDAVMMADLNPVFEQIVSQMKNVNSDEFSRVIINKQLKDMMSSNHNSKGQSVLFGDGSAAFKKTRLINGDDIYTASDKDQYSGTEKPCDISDAFLVP